MRERTISKLEVEQTLADPLEVRETRYGRKVACRRVGGDSYLLIIFERSAEELIVVTALKVNRGVPENMASLEFDRKVNALYLRLRKGKVASTEPLADNMAVDLDKDGKVLGLELILPGDIREEIKAQIIKAV